MFPKALITAVRARLVNGGDALRRRLVSCAALIPLLMGGGISAAQTINNPVPTLGSISPVSVSAGAAGFTLIALGDNFKSSSVVRWNGVDRTTAYISAYKLYATIPAADIAAAGTVSVTVFAPAPGGGISAARTFTINGPNNPAPTLGSINPGSANAGGADFALTATGNFLSSSVVRWNGANRITTFVSATQLTATIPAADIAAAGTRSVTIFTPTPGGGASAARTFTINAANNPAPTLSSISPGNATAGAAGFTLAVTGSNFVSSSVVRWNGANRTTTFVSATQLTATIPASDISVAGTRPVTVFTPTPGGGTSAAQTFTINAAGANNPVPILGSISPVSANAGGAGFTLIAIGSNFVASSVVRSNGVNRATAYISPTKLYATIPAADIAAAGTVSVTVFTPSPGGGTSATRTFTINAPNSPVPTLSSISPGSGTAGGAGFTLTATGSNFVSSSVIRWNGVNRPTTLVGATQLTATIAAGDIGAAGTRPVSVFTPTPGGGTSAARTFTINMLVANPAPTLSSISPGSASAGGADFTLTATGSNFVASSVIRWNGTDRPTTVVTATQLTATIAAADISTAGTRPVTVFTPAPGGGASAAQTFTINAPPAAAIYEQVLTETTKNYDAAGGKPLPLASLWNASPSSTNDCSGWITPDVQQYLTSINGGCADLGINPDVQFELISQGHHILPVFEFNYQPDLIGKVSNPAYYTTLETASNHRLPIVLATTQFERLFADPGSFSSDEMRKLGITVPISGDVVFPFDDAETKQLWRRAGEKWAAHPEIGIFTGRYPDPSRIFVLSNNEHPRVNWQHVISACDTHAPVCDFLARNGIQRTTGDTNPWSENNNKLRAALARAWSNHYQSFFEGFRSGLPTAWRNAAKFIAYEDFITHNYGFDPRRSEFIYPGNWDNAIKESKGYKQTSWLEGGTRGSITMNAGTGNAVPWADTWYGNSASLFHFEGTNNLMSSHLIRSQGQVFALKDVLQNKRSDYWFEFSTYNFADFRLQTDVPSADSVLGWEGQLQMQLWLFQPRVARNFSLKGTPRDRTLPFFSSTIRAVDRVWNNDVLRRFWRDSQLVALDDIPHPFSADPIPGFENEKRWFFLRNGLDTYLDGPDGSICYFDQNSRRWHFQVDPARGVDHGCPDTIRILAVARQTGQAPNREWLVYAFTPLVGAAEFRDVRVSIPGYRDIVLSSVTRTGVFYHVIENQAPTMVAN